MSAKPKSDPTPSVPDAREASPGLEVELKLQVAAGDLTRLVRHPILTAAHDGTPVSRRLITTYFDTPDFQLAARGLALRVRRIGNERIQSIKTFDNGAATDPAGVAVRREWEWKIRDDHPDLSLLTPDVLRGALPHDAVSNLRPIFVTDLQRTTLLLRTAKLTAIEIALDTGEIRAGDARTPINEVELELKAGRVGQLFDLARELQRSVPLRITTRSKADIGFDLVNGTAPAPVKAAPLAMTPMTTLAEAFRHIVRNSISHLLANEPCVLSGLDPEGIHQMRVALRRLRSALVLFSDYIQSAEGLQLADEVRWLGGRLGAARDRDVLLTRYFDRFKNDRRPSPGIEQLRHAIEQIRQVAQGSAIEAMRAPRYTSLLLTIGGWIEDGRWYEGAAAGLMPSLDQPVIELAHRWLAKRHRKVRRIGRQIARMEPEDRHRLRIAVKKLRYATDFFRGLYPAATTRAYLNAVETLQDVLGDINDATVSGHLVESLCRGEEGDGRKAARDLSDWIAEQGHHQLQQLGDCWKTFTEVEPFWTAEAA
ncbi:MAG: CYTH and CHAD domain-containing protein [Azospirillaceae bacterium]|nr:CYTH and CHAD domain-containing protein [Azospirillaceae bacterium]